MVIKLVLAIIVLFSAVTAWALECEPTRTAEVVTTTEEGGGGLVANQAMDAMPGLATMVSDKFGQYAFEQKTYVQSRKTKISTEGNYMYHDEARLEYYCSRQPDNKEVSAKCASFCIKYTTSVYLD